MTKRTSNMVAHDLESPQPQKAIPQPANNATINGSVLIIKAIADQNGCMQDNFISQYNYITQHINKTDNIKHVIIDFENVASLSSTALVTTMRLRRKADTHGGRLILCSMCPNLRSIFASTRMDRLITITETADEAIALLETKSDEPGKSISKNVESLHMDDYGDTLDISIEVPVSLMVDKDIFPSSSENALDRPSMLAALISTVPRDIDYDTLFRGLAELGHEFRREMAERLAPMLNDKIQGTKESPAIPHATYEEKKALAGWVNDQLDPLGLAVKCPKTGLPARLHGDTGSYPEIGRFQFQVATGKGRPVRTFSTPELPKLELIDANLPKHLELDWQQKVGSKEGRGGRTPT